MNMPPCVENIPPGGVLCDYMCCDELWSSSPIHAICNCIDWQGNPIPNCAPKDQTYPIMAFQCTNSASGEIRDIGIQACQALGDPWSVQQCYCCCSCLASQTPVAAPDGFRAIGDYAVGDEVLAASATDGSWTWAPRTVRFAAGSSPPAGAGPADGTIMLYVEYGDGQSLIASTKQLFLLAGGKLQRADRLVPGADRLVSADGAPVDIHRLATGHYKGGIHHIATDAPGYGDWNGSIDNHLINANGVICGDYLLQLYEATPKMAPHLASTDAPTFGTEAYKAAAPALAIKPYVVGHNLETAGIEVSNPDFLAHGPSQIVIPDGAAQLFSPTVEQQLTSPAIPKRGFSDQTNVRLTQYQLTLLGAFFPDVSLVLDWESQRPNVFAFDDESGRAIVVISGELLRLGPLYDAAMGIALAFGIANRHIAADSNHVGRSLYDGISVVLRQALQGGDTCASALAAGQSQFDALLGLVKVTEEIVVPGELTASCMAAVIDAAVSGGPLPDCAAAPGAGMADKSAPQSDALRA